MASRRALAKERGAPPTLRLHLQAAREQLVRMEEKDPTGAKLAEGGCRGPRAIQAGGTREILDSFEEVTMNFPRIHQVCLSASRKQGGGRLSMGQEKHLLARQAYLEREAFGASLPKPRESPSQHHEPGRASENPARAERHQALPLPSSRIASEPSPCRRDYPDMHQRMPSGYRQCMRVSRYQGDKWRRETEAEPYGSLAKRGAYEELNENIWSRDGSASQERNHTEERAAKSIQIQAGDFHRMSLQPENPKEKRRDVAPAVPWEASLEEEPGRRLAFGKSVDDGGDSVAREALRKGTSACPYLESEEGFAPRSPHGFLAVEGQFRCSRLSPDPDGSLCFCRVVSSVSSQ
ncbi:hypothetical protein JRQ81_012167 [Phrynocephalus forsythii]|uniref:Uncharacterized protein n=1 Tax=Phrynocephalus forsythii TaxID=171643 RepID=A0A9Q0X5D5_9SAUR|nr:hypothetical protein JRQ81_012167 [Phrynocephalus forsythii]